MMQCDAWAPDTYCQVGPLTAYQPNRWTTVRWLCAVHLPKED